MSTRLGWLFATAALSATCRIAPGHVAGAGKSTIVIGSRRRTLDSKEPGPLSPYFQGGLLLAATPAYAKGAIALEWLPHPALQLIVESTLYRYFGSDAALRLGPFNEIARASAAAIVQQRAALVAVWTIADDLGPLRRPGLGLEAGFHLSDPNRQGESYFLLGIETFFDINKCYVSKVLLTVMAECPNPLFPTCERRMKGVCCPVA